MKTALLFGLLWLSSLAVQATHILGGYIQSKVVAGSTLTYEITVVVYMNASIAATAQATSYSVCFGDGSSATATRVNQQLLSLGTNSLYSSINISSYRINHSYAGPGTYTLTTSLSNRTTSLNITSNAEQQELLVLTTTFSTISGANQTPSLSIPAMGFEVALNQKIVLSLNATDADGDSLVYELAKPLTSNTNDICTHRPVATYQFPNDLTHQGTFKLNYRTGDLTWNAPAKEGYYSVAITVDEYRNGILLSQTTQEIPLIAEDRPGSPAPIPAYEPAIEGTGIVTAIANYVDADFQLTAFPSPVDNQLQVVIQTSNPDTATVQLLDINGRKLQELSFNRAARQHEQVISTASLTPGMYLVQANVSGRTLLRKIVKR